MWDYALMILVIILNGVITLSLINQYHLPKSDGLFVLALFNMTMGAVMGLIISNVLFKRIEHDQ